MVRSPPSPSPHPFCRVLLLTQWTTVPNEPFPFAFYPPVKTGPPYSDVVEYFFCRSDGQRCLEGVFANLNCSSRYHTRWTMLQAIRRIFNGQDYYMGYGGSCVCGPRYTSAPLVKCVCLPWPKPREPVVVLKIEEEKTTWKMKKKESSCVVM